MMLLTILPLAACGNKTDDSTEPDIIGMPNPFTDFDTLAEAEKQTGFISPCPMPSAAQIIKYTAR